MGKGGKKPQNYFFATGKPKTICHSDVQSLGNVQSGQRKRILSSQLNTVNKVYQE